MCYHFGQLQLNLVGDVKHISQSYLIRGNRELAIFGWGLLPGAFNSLSLLACKQSGILQSEKALKQRVTGADGWKSGQYKAEFRYTILLVLTTGCLLCSPSFFCFSHHLISYYDASYFLSPHISSLLSGTLLCCLRLDSLPPRKICVTSVARVTVKMDRSGMIHTATRSKHWWVSKTTYLVMPLSQLFVLKI